MTGGCLNWGDVDFSEAANEWISIYILIGEIEADYLKDVRAHVYMCR